MKKILTFIDWYWPGYKAGGPIRSLVNMTSHLSHDLSFFIVTRNTDYMSSEPYTEIESNSWNQIAPNINVFYLSDDQINAKKIKSFFLQADYNIVYINGIYSKYFSILPLKFSKSHKFKTIVAPRGMLSGQTFSSKKFLKKLFFSYAKLTTLYKGIRFHATVQKESDDIVKHLKINPANIHIAANLPRKLSDTKPTGIIKEKGNLKLISIARISPEKNILFAIQSLKGINSGNIQLDLFGEIYNQDYWKQCQKAIRELPENIRVEFKGSVQGDQIPKLLRQYHCLLMPSQGENFGHSILESLMAGNPVIISQNTPWRNLEGKKAGWDISLNKIDNFKSTLTECLSMTDEDYQVWSDGAFQLAKDFVSDEKLSMDNKKLFS